MIRQIWVQWRVVIVLVLLSVTILRGLYVSWKSRSMLDYSQSVLQFAGPQKSGIFYISEVPEDFRLRPLWGEAGLDGATKNQVLVLKDQRRSVLLWGQTQAGRGRLVATDLNVSTEAPSNLWSADLGGKVLYSTPIVLADRKEIWAMTQDLSGQNYSQFERDPEARFRPVLQMFDFDGNKKCEYEIDLGERATRLHCTTGLAYEPLTQKLVFGCSSRQILGFKKPMYRQDSRQRGALGIVDISSKSCPDQSALTLWTSTNVTDDPRGGFDTGIWMAGAAPLTPGDGSVWFSTGNGFFSPETGNYGCSILRLDLQKDPLSPEVIWAHDQVSPSLRTQECLGMNIDPSSSGLGMAADQPAEKFYGISKIPQWSYVTLGKDSLLKWGQGSERKPPQTHRVAWYLNYGQPAARMEPNETLRTWMTLMVPQAQEAKDERWFETSADQCQVVLWRNPPEPKAEEMLQFYSGPFRQDRLMATETSDTAVQLRSMTSVWSDPKISYRHPEPSFPPYVKEKSLGWTSKAVGPAPSGFVRQSLMTRKGSTVFDLHSQLAAGGSSGSANRQVVKAGDVWVPTTAQKCQALDPAKFVFLKSETEFIYPGLRFENRLDAYQVRGQHLPQRKARWSESDPQWKMSRNSVAVGMSPSGRTLAVFSLHSENEEPDPNNPGGVLTRSRLLVVDANSEKLLADIPLAGTVHFSMPVFFQNKIFVTTRKPSRLYAFQWDPVAAKVVTD